MIRNKNLLRIPVILIIISNLAIIGTFAEDTNDDEVGVWYETFSTDPTLQNRIPFAEDEAKAFSDGLGNAGWDKKTPQGNAASTSADWTTSDTDDADSVDIALIASHGKGDDATEECAIATGTVFNDPLTVGFWASDCTWGNTDVEWVVLYACHSLDADYYDSWADAFDGLHGILGFQGMATLDDELLLCEYFVEELIDNDESIHDAWEFATQDFYGDKSDSATAAIYRYRCYVDYPDPFYYDYGDEKIDELNPDDGVSDWSYNNLLHNSWGCPN